MSTEFTIPYGKRQLSLRLPQPWHAELIMPTEVLAASDPQRAVNEALDRPVGGQVLSDFTGVRSAAIAINDKTRPVPHQELLPPLLRRLTEAGLAPDAITLIIATGTHPSMPPEEFERVVPPDILARYPVICHNADKQENLAYLGQSKRGTPVWLNRHFVQAELRIVVGNIEPHQFMGFSGGVKSAVIGLGGKETINHNHAMMTAPQARLGRYEDNPARQDVEDMGRLVGVYFALNAILNENKQIVAVFAGEPTTVMQQGIPQVRQLYQVDVSRPFDLTIAAPGGHPKDINLYQAQKGLAHAALVTKDGGTIVLAAACPEGTGSDTYEQWMAGKRSYQDVFESFGREGFRVGPHKAFQIARDAARVRVLLMSDMEDDFVRRLLLTPVASLEEALSLVKADLPATAHVGVMPLANATIPVLQPG